MTLAVQVSAKTNNGTIYVLGANTVDEFKVNLVALYGGDEAAEAAAEEMLEEMAKVLSPMGAAVQNVMQAFPGSQVMQQPQGGGYGQQGQPQPQYGGGQRIAQQDTYFQSSFADKDAVKAAGGRWGKERRSWYAPQGSDLNAFARWGI